MDMGYKKKCKEIFDEADKGINQPMSKAQKIAEEAHKGLKKK